MMSLAAIRQRSREAAERAAANNKRPLVFELEDFPLPDPSSPHGPSIPFLGDHRPDGWTLQETVFVDSTGLGDRSEPAMTQGAFLSVIEQWARKRRHERDTQPLVGWAVVEAGQFQVHVGRFTKDGS